jgi:integrase
MDPTGKTVWVYAPTERECWGKLDRKRTDRLLQIERGPVEALPKPQEAHEAVPWLLAWATGQQGHPSRWRPSTRKRALELLACLTRFGAWEGRTLEDIRIRDVQALTDQAGKGPWPSKWSPRTVRHLHSCLRVGFGDAIRDGIPLTVNPTVGVILPELAAPHRISLNDEERTELIEESLRRENGQPVHRLGDLIAFLALTGLRSGEARALTFDDVDLGKREASITKTIAIGDNSRLSIGPPKRKSSTRSVALPTLAVKIIQARADEVGISRSELGPYRSSRETIQIGARY